MYPHASHNRHSAAVRLLLGVCIVLGPVALCGCPPAADPPDAPNDNSGTSGDSGTGGGDTSSGGDTAGSGSNTSGGASVGGDPSVGGDNGTSGGDGTSGQSGDGTGDGSGGTLGDGSAGDTGGSGDTGNSGGTGNDPPPGDPPPRDPPPTDPPAGTDPTRIELELIARTGDPVPDQGEGAAFDVFSDPIIDSEGRIAFWAAYGGGGGDAGLYVFQDGVLARVVDDDPDNNINVPGGSAGDTFGDFDVNEEDGAPGFSWGDGARLIFAAETKEPTSATQGIYRWRATDGDLVEVLDTLRFIAIFPDAMEGRNAGTADFSNPLVSDSGVVVFQTLYTYVTTSRGFVLRNTGVFAANGVNTLPLADQRFTPFGDVPGQGADAAFEMFGERIAMNVVGDVVLQASYEDGVGDRGVYLYGSGGLMRALDNSGDDFAGLPAGAVVGTAGEDFAALAIGNGGEIAIQTSLTVDGRTHDTVLIWNGTQWSELAADDGTPAAALLSGVNGSGQCLVLADTRPHLVDADGNSRDLSATLPAELEGVDIIWQPTGGSINSAGRCLIPYIRPNGTEQPTPGLAFWTGAELLVVVDPVAEIPSATISGVFTPGSPELDYVGRSAALNGENEIVFRVVENGDVASQSIYIARPLP